MEIQQAPYYAQYIRSLKWTVESVSGSYLFIKRFPFLGSVMKIQRVTTLPDTKAISLLIKKYRVKILSIEPDRILPRTDTETWMASLPKNVYISKDYYLPTKTIYIDLTRTQDTIFASFTEAKRRAVRRATKNLVETFESEDIRTFLSLKNKSAGLFGSITTHGMDKLWAAFPRQNKAIILAKAPQSTKRFFTHVRKEENLVGGILLFFWNDIAYYWIAGATHDGKKLFAPTLLVWEAIKLSKNRQATSLDLVGAWDERIPKQNTEWKGFTKFKEGFGGQEIYYNLHPKLKS